jgi:hypothetical protein
MIALIKPPGMRTFSDLQMHLPNSPLGLACIVATIRDPVLPYQVVAGTGEALDVVRPYPAATTSRSRGCPLTRSQPG